ncbi:MAG: ATP-grasp domain-containing protein [Planctomycetota bacterium]
MTAPSRPVRVAVTGMHLGENCQPGPGVASSLRRALGDAVFVVGLGYDAMDSGLHDRGLVDDAFLLPYPSSGPDAFVERLLAIHGEAPFDVLIPCLDAELPVLSRAAKDLEREGVALIVPGEERLSRCSKSRLPELARSCSIETPVTRPVVDLGGLAMAGRELGYPLLVKGPYYEAEVADGEAAAAAAFARLSARWGLPIIAQQFVEGEEFDVAALGDGQGNTLGAVAMRKTMITRLGKAWGGVTVEDEELTAAASRLIAELEWPGGCEVEMLRSRRDGRVHLIELNPRFPAWIQLSAVAGVNLPEGLLRLALGEPVSEFPPPRPGVWYVRHATERFGDLSDLESLMTTSRRIFSSSSKA